MADELIIDVGADIGGADKEFSKLNKEIDKTGQNVESAGKKGGGFMGVLGNIGGGISSMLSPAALLTGGIGLLGGALLGAGKSAAEEQVGIDRLQNTLKNSVAGYNEATAGVEDYIAQKEKLAFADDQLRDSLNFLVGQTGDLTEAQQLQADAMDLARAKGIDLQTATKAVGKVDQDSIGILKKLGIQVTENMTKEEALTAIRKTSAGAAETYAKSAAGSMERLQTSMGDAIENIGGMVLPALTTALGGLAEFGTAIATAFSTGDFSQVGTLIVNTFNGVITWISGAIGPLTSALGGWITAFVGWIGPMIPQIIGGLVGLLGSILGWIGEQLPAFVEAVAGWARAFIEWIGPMIPQWISAAAGFIGAVINWLGDQVPKIASKIGEWVVAFWKWLGDVIPPMLSKAGELLTSLIKWLGEAVPVIVAKLGEWVLGFLGWILPLIPPMLLKLGEVLVAIGGWLLTTALPELVKMLLQWAGAFLGWIAKDVLPFLAGKLGEIWTAVSSWIVTTAASIGTAIVAFATNFWKWITEVLTWIGAKLGEIWTAIWTWISTTATSIGTEVAKFVTSFWTWITDVVTNIGGKLAEVWNSISSWIGTTAKNVVSAVKSVGEGIVQGIMDGLGGAAKAIGDFIWGVAKNIWNSIVGFFTGEAEKHKGGILGPTAGQRAVGGPVQGNRGYIVGEDGPEFFMPGSSGHIIPNNETEQFIRGNASAWEGHLGRNPSLIGGPAGGGGNVGVTPIVVAPEQTFVVYVNGVEYPAKVVSRDVGFRRRNMRGSAA